MPKIKLSFIIALIVLIIGCVVYNSIDVVHNFAPVVYAANVEETKVLYAPDGRTRDTKVSEVDDYLKVGWYAEPVQYLYDINGYAKVVYKKDVQNLINSKKWFLTKPMLNKDDIILLAKVIYAEATENPDLRVLDRQYVGAVVMNRLRSGHYGNKLSAVVYAPNQYSCIYLSKFKRFPPDECILIAKYLLNGETYGVPSNVFYQAQFRQGSGVWKQVGAHYYCYR